MKTETEYSGANVLGARNGQCQSSEWDGRHCPIQQRLAHSGLESLQYGERLWHAVHKHHDRRV